MQRCVAAMPVWCAPEKVDVRNGGRFARYTNMKHILYMIIYIQLYKKIYIQSELSVGEKRSIRD